MFNHGQLRIRRALAPVFFSSKRQFPPPLPPPPASMPPLSWSNATQKHHHPPWTLVSAPKTPWSPVRVLYWSCISLTWLTAAVRLLLSPTLARLCVLAAVSGELPNIASTRAPTATNTTTPTVTTTVTATVLVAAWLRGGNCDLLLLPHESWLHAAAREWVALLWNQTIPIVWFLTQLAHSGVLMPSPTSASPPLASSRPSPPSPPPRCLASRADAIWMLVVGCCVALMTWYEGKPQEWAVEWGIEWCVVGVSLIGLYACNSQLRPRSSSQAHATAHAPTHVLLLLLLVTTILPLEPLPADTTPSSARVWLWSALLSFALTGEGVAWMLQTFASRKHLWPRVYSPSSSMLAPASTLVSTRLSTEALVGDLRWGVFALLHHLLFCFAEFLPLVTLVLVTGMTWWLWHTTTASTNSLRHCELHASAVALFALASAFAAISTAGSPQQGIWFPAVGRRLFVSAGLAWTWQYQWIPVATQRAN